jgi:SAM-dependent methyltransferase
VLPNSVLSSSRSLAYDNHYRTLWHSRCFTKKDLESYFANFLDVEAGGSLNGNEIQHAFRILGVPNISGKVILDYCCGTGVAAIYFAMLGARIFAFDRSHAAIEIAKESATLSGVGHIVNFGVADGRELPFQAEAFDAVFCQSALHIIVDYKECFNELARVLKPGSKAVFCDEALGYNPILEAIRYSRRKKYSDCGGRPLKYGDLSQPAKHFTGIRLHHFNLFLQIKNFMKESPRSKVVRHIFTWLDKIDRSLLEVLPSVRHFCGKIVVEFIR